MVPGLDAGHETDGSLMRVPLPIAVFFTSRFLLAWLTGETRADMMLWPPDWQTVLSFGLAIASLGLYWLILTEEPPPPLTYRERNEARRPARKRKVVRDEASWRCRACGKLNGVHADNCPESPIAQR